LEKAESLLSISQLQIYHENISSSNSIYLVGVIFQGDITARSNNNASSLEYIFFHFHFFFIIHQVAQFNFDTFQINIEEPNLSAIIFEGNILIENNVANPDSINGNSFCIFFLLN